MYRLSAQTIISAAHKLNNYNGPCARLHGHNWKIRVEVSANQLDEVGITLDFDEIKKLTWQVVGKFDHNYFNEIPPFDKINPTAENIVKYIFEEFCKIIPKEVRLEKVSLWETEEFKIDYAG